MTPSNTKTEAPVKTETAVKPETTTKPKTDAKAKTTEKVKAAPTPKNAANYKKAVDLGKELSKKPDTTKMDVATKMYDLIKDEAREVISMAFVEGANLTPKGSMTYVYNIRRKLKKSAYRFTSLSVCGEVVILTNYHLFCF